MRFLTYNEWLEANQDLVDDFRAETHASGVPYGLLIDLGDEDARHEFDRHFQLCYQAQLERDQAKWNAWQELTR